MIDIIFPSALKGIDDNFLKKLKIKKLFLMEKATQESLVSVETSVLKREDYVVFEDISSFHRMLFMKRPRLVFFHPIYRMKVDYSTVNIIKENDKIPCLFFSDFIDNFEKSFKNALKLAKFAKKKKLEVFVFSGGKEKEHLRPLWNYKYLLMSLGFNEEQANRFLKREVMFFENY